MKKRFKLSSSDIATAAIFLSFILIFVLVPMPNPAGLSMAFIPLIAVILACDVKGLGMGLFTGLSFGIASLINSYLHPTLLAPIFHNPMVSVVPRIIIPISAYFAFKGVKWLFRKRSADASTYLASITSSVAGVCTNTGLVLAMMAAFELGHVYGNTKIDAAFFGGLLGLNFLIEIVICTLVTPMVATALRIALRIDKKGRKPLPKEALPEEEALSSQESSESASTVEENSEITDDFKK